MEINKYNNITLREALNDLTSSYDMEYLTSHFIHGLYDVSELTDEKFKVAVTNVSILIASLMALPRKETNNLIGLDVYVNDTDSANLVNDAYYTLPNVKDKYALDFLDWADIIDARIDENSIINHGLLNVVVATLIELSFYGYDYETAMKGLQETKTSINIA